MAIDLGNKYVNTGAPSSDYPHGSFKNSSDPALFDGTPADKDWANDIWGFFEALLALAGIAPSGVPDTAQASQKLQALQAVFATIAVVNTKAPIASPTLTGVPAAPTAAPGTDSTQIATTAFVAAAINALLSGAPGALDTLNELAAALGNDGNFAANVTNALALKAPLASPALTGVPTAPTAFWDNNSNQVATTAFVQSAGLARVVVKKTGTGIPQIFVNGVAMLTGEGSITLPVGSMFTLQYNAAVSVLKWYDYRTDNRIAQAQDGDVDGDGRLTNLDTNLILQRAVNPATVFIREVGDVDNSGVVDAADALVVSQRATGVAGPTTAYNIIAIPATSMQFTVLGYMGIDITYP